jgi:hypothetical protein
MKAGDTLFAVTQHHGNYTVTVAKVGRKWATLEGWQRWRVLIETGVIRDGDWNVGRVYESEAAWQLKNDTDDLWWLFRSKVNHHTKPVTIAVIRKAASILDIDLGDGN